MRFTQCQSKALTILNGNDNVFLSGAAGTGKSFLLQQYLHEKGRKEYPVLASTGAAAVIVDGRTFHSFFGLGILEGGKDATVARALRSGPLRSRLEQAVTVVIDEVSMLSGQTVAAAEEIARRLRGSEKPWGGLRIIAVGDFAQLPPVQQGNMPKDWAFTHEVWENSAFVPVYLEETVRTGEPRLLAVLREVREGNVTKEVREFLQERSFPADALFEGTRLFPRRASAHRYNMERLQQLEGQLHTFETAYAGRGRSVEQLKKQCPVSDVLHLKKNALVMLRKNDTAFPYQYVNGTLGTVTAMDDEFLTLRLLNGKTVDIGKEEFSLLDGNGVPQATAYNFPVTLAWATTIHKAQGASIDRLMVSMAGLWESGHAYVALSRARSEQGLFIEQWDDRSIFTDIEVQRFYARVRADWQDISAAIADTTNTEPSPVAAPSRPKGKKKARKANHDQTAELLAKKASLAHIAEQLDLKSDTIVGHIEKLIEQQKQVDFAHLKPSADVFDPIAAAFAENGMEFLKPVHDALDGAFSYSQLKLVRIFLINTIQSR